MHDLVPHPRLLLTFRIPEPDSAEFAMLPVPARDKIHWLFRCFAVIARSERRTEACEQVAKAAGVSFNTIYNPWRKYAASADWRVLIDRRMAARFWLRADAAGLPADFIAEWQRRCDLNQRAFKPVWRQLIDDWKQWRAGDTSKAVPGYPECPPPDAGGIPAGWSYRNLLLHAPDDVATAATRNGRTAAKKLAGGIRTTRVGSYAFREIQFDDFWHDFKTNVPGSKQAVRLLQFHAVEQYTTFIFRPGLKPRLTDSDTGRNKQLSERDFHLFLVNWLIDWGIHPDGTVLQAENGTARIKGWVADRLPVWFGDRVEVRTGGMSGAPAFPGAYCERGKGNPNCKGLLEGSGKIIHNQLASLPGQVGMDRNDLPASLHGRDNENKLLLAISEAMPELREKLAFGFLSLSESVAAVNAAIDLINSRTDHDIEGWDECGFVLDQFRISQSGDLWLPASQLSEADRLTLQIALRHDPSILRRRRMSPAEALQASMPRLMKLPREAVPDLLGKEYGEVVAPRDGRFHLTRPEFGNRPLRYLSTYQDSGGLRRRVENGHSVLLHFNPWKPETVYLSNPKNGAFLGIAERDHSVCRADREAVMRAHGRAVAELTETLAPVAARQGLSVLPTLRANTAAIRSATRPTSRDLALSTAALPAEAMLDEQSTADQPDLTPNPAVAFDPSDIIPDTSALLD